MKFLYKQVINLWFHESIYSSHCWSWRGRVQSRPKFKGGSFEGEPTQNFSQIPNPNRVQNVQFGFLSPFFNPNLGSASLIASWKPSPLLPSHLLVVLILGFAFLAFLGFLVGFPCEIRLFDWVLQGIVSLCSGFLFGKRIG